MQRARAHRRLAGFGAFALLALVAEISGRSLTVRLDLGRHVATPSYTRRELLPVPARRREGRRRADARRARPGASSRRAPRPARARRLLARRRRARRAHAARPRSTLSLRSWALAYALTAGIYLVQTDSERFAAGQWPLVSPWLHTSALSVFAVLSVLVALRLRRGLALARRLRALRRAGGRGGTLSPAPARAARHAARAQRRSILRGASSGSPSSPARLPPRRKPGRPPGLVRRPREEEMNEQYRNTTRRRARGRRGYELAHRGSCRSRSAHRARGRRVGDRPAVPRHAAAPARRDLLVARSSSRRCS